MKHSPYIFLHIVGAVHIISKKATILLFDASIHQKCQSTVLTQPKKLDFRFKNLALDLDFSEFEISAYY